MSTPLLGSGLFQVVGNAKLQLKDSDATFHLTTLDNPNMLTQQRMQPSSTIRKPTFSGKFTVIAALRMDLSIWIIAAWKSAETEADHIRGQTRVMSKWTWSSKNPAPPTEIPRIWAKWFRQRYRERITIVFSIIHPRFQTRCVAVSLVSSRMRTTRRYQSQMYTSSLLIEILLVSLTKACKTICKCRNSCPYLLVPTLLFTECKVFQLLFKLRPVGAYTWSFTQFDDEILRKCGAI